MMIKEDARWVLGVGVAAAAAGMIGCGVVQWRSPDVDPYVAKTIGPGVITKQNTVSTDTTPSEYAYNIRLPDGKSVRVEDVSPSIYYALGIPGAKVTCDNLSFTEKNTETNQPSVKNRNQCTVSFLEYLTVKAATNNSSATDNSSEDNKNYAVFTFKDGEKIAVILPEDTGVVQGNAYKIALKEAIVPASNFMGYKQGVALTATQLKNIGQGQLSQITR